MSIEYMNEWMYNIKIVIKNNIKKINFKLYETNLYKIFW